MGQAKEEMHRHEQEEDTRIFMAEMVKLHQEHPEYSLSELMLRTVEVLEDKDQAERLANQLAKDD